MCKVTKNLMLFSDFDDEYFSSGPVLDCQGSKACNSEVITASTREIKTIQTKKKKWKILVLSKAEKIFSRGEGSVFSLKI